jgi:DNA polymerase-1
MSHQAPNQGNIPSDPEVKDPSNPTQYELVQLKYGMNLRKVWRVNEGERLLGVDADGIQLRIFAHYIDDPDFTAALVSGKKEDGTDPHTLNAVKLGIGPERRSMAKTFDKIEVYKTVKFSGTLVRDNTEPSLMFQ